ADAAFDGVQHLLAPFERLGVILVVLRDARVEIPAVVVESDGRVGEQRAHVGGGRVFEMVEADHYVGDLYAGVIDVVLDFDAIAAGAQHAHEGVAEHGVAQVPDVGGFVRVDVGVLDDDLFTRALGGFGRAGEQRRAVRAAVEADVDVAVAGDLHRLD